MRGMPDGDERREKLHKVAYYISSQINLLKTEIFMFGGVSVKYARMFIFRHYIN